MSKHFSLIIVTSVVLKQDTFSCIVHSPEFPRQSLTTCHVSGTLTESGMSARQFLCCSGCLVPTLALLEHLMSSGVPFFLSCGHATHIRGENNFPSQVQSPPHPQLPVYHLSVLTTNFFSPHLQYMRGWLASGVCVRRNTDPLCLCRVVLVMVWIKLSVTFWKPCGPVSVLFPSWRFCNFQVGVVVLGRGDGVGWRGGCSWGFWYK